MMYQYLLRLRAYNKMIMMNIRLERSKELID